MGKKYVLLLAILLCLNSLFAVSECAGLFTKINTSATDVAFGLDSGAANIWNTSPLSVWSNPAKLGYHKGFAFGYSDDPYLEDTFSSIYHRSSYISYGWNGIGILLPAPSAKSRWGTVMSYGEQEVMNELGEVIGSVESFEACSKFAVGVNTFQFISHLTQNQKLIDFQKYAEFSVGFNYDIIHSKLAPQGSGETESQPRSPANAHSTGIGLIGRISPLEIIQVPTRHLNFDITCGFYWLNPFETEIEYGNDKDPLPYGTTSAFAGKISLRNTCIFQDNTLQFLENFSQNLISVYYSQDNTQYGEEEEYHNPGVWGEGFEITFLDIFSFRKGYYSDPIGEIKGETEGFGINFNYCDLIQLQYNYVEFPGGGLQLKQEKTDFLIRLDFLQIYGLLN